MTTYKSKTRLLPILLVFIIIGGLGLFIFNSSALALQILFGIVVFMGLLLIFSKKYVIDNKVLLIKIAGFRQQVIPIEQIQEIKPLKSMVDSGFHLDRLVILYRMNKDFDYIAPKKQKEFIANLYRLNPQIKIHEKLKPIETDSLN